MKRILVLFLLSCSIMIGQESISKKLGEFNTLKVYNGLTVELQKAGKSKIEITGSQADEVSVKNSDGILKIRLKFPDSFSPNDVRIVLSYKGEIDILDANEGALIVSEKTIKQSHLELRVQEGARINVTINTKHLVVKTVSGGIINLSGSTDNQQVEATTGGIYKAYELKSDDCTVLAASGAKTEVQAKDRLDARVRFGGMVYYTGSPEILKTKKVIGGTIKNIDS